MSDMFCAVGYSNPNFTLNLGEFDTSKVIDMSYMFYETGYNSTVMNVILTIRNPNITNFESIFEECALTSGSKIEVNSIDELTSEKVDYMITEKTNNANIIKGKLVI